MKLKLLESLSKSKVDSISTTPIPVIPTGLSREDWFRWYGDEYLKSEHWAHVRKTILARDKHRCRFCGCSSTISNHLEIHHRDYQHLYKELSDDSCVLTLCKRCHRGLHRVVKY